MAGSGNRASHKRIRRDKQEKSEQGGIGEAQRRRSAEDTQSSQSIVVEHAVQLPSKFWTVEPGQRSNSRDDSRTSIHFCTS
jgi:hypothetical protein